MQSSADVEVTFFIELVRCCAKKQERQLSARFVMFAILISAKKRSSMPKIALGVSIFWSTERLAIFWPKQSRCLPRVFATVMSIDALGTFNMTRAAYSLLEQSTKDAIVINISAVLQYGATWWQSHASAAKSAVDSLTRSLALEWGSSSIRVVGIAPGSVANTPGTSKLATDKTAYRFRDVIPLGRHGEASEIGLAAIYLCTAMYVTGHVLVVDGGFWLYREPWAPKELS